MNAAEARGDGGDRGGGDGALIRAGGIAVLVALALHVVLNAFVKTFPPADPTAAELAAYLAAQADAWAIVHGGRYPALVGLALFGAAAFARTRRNGGTGWAVFGLIGTVLHVANAIVANGVEILAFRDFELLSGDPARFRSLFHLVRTLFAAEIVAWGVTIFGFSMAGLRSARLPRWIGWLGLACGPACLAASMLVVPILRGAAVGLVLDLTTLAGLIWFAGAGIYLALRGDT